MTRQRALNGRDLGFANIATAPTLQGLQNADFSELIDVIDTLRGSHRLRSKMQLPQLVVCGDQSSGKSSVLESITRVHFPRNQSLCTRFATEIILRRKLKESIVATIKPQGKSSEALRSFKTTLHDLAQLADELPKIIDEATSLMGLTDKNSKKTTSGPNDQDGLKAFSPHVLSIEISGPNQIDLTVVDLPGLIQSETKYHSRQDKDFIPRFVKSWLQHKRTIILAVVSGSIDASNQAVLSLVKEVDAKGKRTLGIITKLDKVQDDEVAAMEKLDLARNLDPVNRFDLGWHLLVNMGNNTDFSFEIRDDNEKEVLSSPFFEEFPEQNKGIEMLRKRLATLLHEQLIHELPVLLIETEKMLSEKYAKRKELGEKRVSPGEQRDLLMNISQSYEKIVKAAVDGNYNDPFFGPYLHIEGDDSEPEDIFLRAKARRFEQQFAAQIKLYGHKFKVLQMGAAPVDIFHYGHKSTELWPEYSRADRRPTQDTMEYDAALNWVKKLLTKTRGRELPSMFDYMLLSRLFWEQSQNWAELGEKHISNIDRVVSNFVKAVIKEVSSQACKEVGKRLHQRIDKVLDERAQRADDELERIINDSKRPVATYGPEFNNNLQEARYAKYSNVQDLEDPPTETPGSWAMFHGGGVTIKQQTVPVKSRKHAPELDDDKLSADHALEALIAYYKPECDHFIRSVLVQVIERNLIDNLAEETLSPLLINKMTEKEMAEIFAEPESVAQERATLEKEINDLKAAEEKFREAIDPLKRNWDDDGEAQENSRSKRISRRRNR